MEEKEKGKYKRIKKRNGHRNKELSYSVSTINKYTSTSLKHYNTWKYDF